MAPRGGNIALVVGPRHDAPPMNDGPKRVSSTMRMGSAELPGDEAPTLHDLRKVAPRPEASASTKPRAGERRTIRGHAPPRRDEATAPVATYDTPSPVLDSVMVDESASEPTTRRAVSLPTPAYVPVEHAVYTLPPLPPRRVTEAPPVAVAPAPRRSLGWAVAGALAFAAVVVTLITALTSTRDARHASTAPRPAVNLSLRYDGSVAPR